MGKAKSTVDRWEDSEFLGEKNTRKIAAYFGVSDEEVMANKLRDGNAGKVIFQELFDRYNKNLFSEQIDDDDIEKMKIALNAGDDNNESTSYPIPGIPRQDPGFHESDVCRFEYDKAKDPQLPPLSDTQFTYRVKSRVLDNINILPGDILIVDIGLRVSSTNNADVVVAQIYDKDTGEGVTVLRQFIKPSLLITNGSYTQPQTDIKTTDAAILGVVIKVIH